jgi:hypothetical protein
VRCPYAPDSPAETLGYCDTLLETDDTPLCHQLGIQGWDSAKRLAADPLPSGASYPRWQDCEPDPRLDLLEDLGREGRWSGAPTG